MLHLLALLHVVVGQNFSFGAAGDFEAGSTFVHTADAVGRAQVDFMVALGDMAYANTEVSWCAQWRVSNVSQLAIVAGNHDTGESCCGTVATYLANCNFSLPYNGTLAYRYFIDYPQSNPYVRFVMIAPGVSGSALPWDAYKMGEAGYIWLESILDDAKSKNMWTIVSMHKNYISVLTKLNELGPDLMNMLFSKPVDIVLQGHEHGYERTKFLRCASPGVFVPGCVVDDDDMYVRGNGTVIVVLGTGGQVLRTVDPQDSEWGYFQLANIVAYGFGRFDVSPTAISYNFVRSDGGALSDSFVISPTPKTKAPSAAPTLQPQSPPTTTAPTNVPTAPPPTTTTPTQAPTTPTRVPTGVPTRNPSGVPTLQPNTRAPTPSGPPTVVSEASTSWLLLSLPALLVLCQV